VGGRENLICAMVCATSADGLRWKVVGDRPSVNEKFEVSGLYRWGNFYYATGQQISPWAWLPDGRPCGRVMTAYRSPDLFHWSRAKAFAFARPVQHNNPAVPGEQTHMGAGIWNRGNVLVGLYGMWHDGPARRPQGAPPLYGMRMDLGLIVSNDGIHFREPVPNFKVIPRGHEGEWDSVALLQGHAFANVGEKTYVWYSHWDCEEKYRSQEIGLATLRRDGFGYLARKVQGAPGHFVTAPLVSGKQGMRLFVNAEGLSAEAPLTVSLLDEFDRPLPGYSGDGAAKVTAPGVRQEVVWPGRKDGLPPSTRFAIKVELPAAGDARVYACYAAD
jgi:hypothetical protein